MTRTAVIVDAVRSPMAKGRAAKEGRPGGALFGIHPADMLGQVLAALFDRTGVDPGIVDDVITGCVSQVGEQSGTVGRWAWLGAGLPEHVPSVWSTGPAAPPSRPLTSPPSPSSPGPAM
jgi:acetyl-CoA acetyltransferase